jgi:hypothetical protein
LKQAITAESAEGKNVQAAQVAETNLETEIAALDADTNGLSAQILAVTPTAFNADVTVLRPSRQQLGAAAAAIAAAETDITTALGDLQ